MLRNLCLDPSPRSHLPKPLPPQAVRTGCQVRYAAYSFQPSPLLLIHWILITNAGPGDAIETRAFSPLRKLTTPDGSPSYSTFLSCDALQPTMSAVVAHRGVLRVIPSQIDEIPRST